MNLDLTIPAAQRVAQPTALTVAGDNRLLLPCLISEKVVFDAGDGSHMVLEARLAASDYGDETMPDDMQFPPEWLRRPFKIVLKGEIESINPFVVYMMSGKVVDNHKYGQQFQCDYHFVREISDKMVLTKYLDRFPHLGRARAAEVVGIFGTNGLDGIATAMDNDGAGLTVINGITPERAKQISTAWQKDFAMRDLYMWMVEIGLPVEKAKDIYGTFGRKAKKLLQQNPYLLTEIRGIGFQSADAIAHRIGNVDAEHRVSACSRYILTEGMRNGDLCAMISNLSSLVRKQLDQFKPQDDFDNFFQLAMKNNFVMMRLFGKIFVYLPEVYKKEKIAAIGLADIAASESRYSVTEHDIDMAEIDVSRWIGRSIKLDDCQRDAIKSAFLNRLTVITGGGGTGKSTICQCIKTISGVSGISTGFLAPTGAAAKVLTDKTGSDGMTVHRALGILPVSKAVAGQRKKEENKIANSNIVVVDEFSMIGIDTVSHIVKMVVANPHMNLVLIGDPQQLPSVSPGNFLFDIISSGVANVVALTKVHRQDSTSYIPQVADEMAKGMFEGIPADATDIHVVDTEDEDAIVASAMSVAKEYLATNGTFDGLQMIASMKTRGAASVESINNVFQALFFNMERDKYVEYNHKRFFVGERVMQRINDYNRDVFNGNIGVVVDCGTRMCPTSGRQEKFVTVEFKNSPVNGVERPSTMCTYVKKQIEDIMTCWCSTVHKFQGSQADTVVFLAPVAHSVMMKRELVYTAMTRAAKVLYIFGSVNLLKRATHASLIKHRNTHTREIMAWRAGRLEIPDLSVKNVHLSEDADGVEVDYSAID